MTILLAEKDLGIAGIISSNLTSAGYRVFHVIDLNSLIKKMREQENISLLLVDIKLGIENETIAKVEEFLKSFAIPILFLFSPSDQALLPRIEKISPYGVVDKYASPSALLASIRIALTLNDTIRKYEEKEKKLLETVDLMQNILDCSTDFIFAKDTELRTILCNEMVAKAVGKKASDLIGHNDIENGVDIELVKGNPEKGIRGYENDDKAALSGETLSNPSDLVYSNGKVYVFDTVKRPLRNRSGEIIGIFGISRDVTEKIKLEATIQRNQKLESIGVLAGGIAHDFNNLLAGIFGYTEIALMHSTNQPTISQYLNKALSAFDRAKALTLQLLTFSKGGAPVKKIVEVAPMLKACVQFSLSGSNLFVQYELNDAIWLTEVDENQIGQVIDNIIINAQHAMSKGGTLTIKVENVILKPEEFPLNSSQKFIKISFQDEGAGIPKEILPRIFDPFFSTKPKGTGLGLSTAFSIIQKHGGFIDVESKVGSGSTFILYLPASEGQSIVSSGTMDRDKHKGNEKILLMDDELHIQDIELMRMESMGYHVSVAGHGDEAVQLFKEAEFSDCPFNLLILDLTIPGGKGGLQTIEEIRKINTTVPAIIASGYSESPAIAEPFKFGFNGSLKKPYANDELIKVLNKFSL